MLISSKCQGLLLCLLSLPLAAQTVASQVGQMRIYQSKHLEIFFTGGFKKETPILAAEAEAFLSELERTWSVQLPDLKIPITLGKAGSDKRLSNHLELPQWLQAGYNKKRRQIEVNILREPGEDIAWVSDGLHHGLVHYLLNLSNEASLPPVWEEGLARYFGRPGKSRDRFLAIWTFYRQKDLKTYLATEESYTNPSAVLYSSAVARLFVSWTFKTYPNARIPIIQAALQGHDINETLITLGLPTQANLLQAFEANTRGDYRLYKIAFTLDFWLIFLGSLTLVFMCVKIFQAWRTCRMPHLEIESLPDSRKIVGAHLFKGPALDFSQMELDTPTQAPAKMDVPADNTPPNDSQSGAYPQLPPLPKDLRNPSLSLPSIPEDHKRPEAINQIYEFDDDLDALESNLDDVFEAMTQSAEQTKKKKDAFIKGVEDDIDQAFGNWD